MAKNKKSWLFAMILGKNNRVSSKRILGSFVIVVMTLMIVVCVFTQVIITTPVVVSLACKHEVV